MGVTDDVRLLFGCETELDKHMTLGVSKEKYDLFDFIVIPITHFHMVGFTLDECETLSPESKADAWIRRFDAVLNMDLPFHKVGLAHLTCSLISKNREEYLKVLDMLPADKMTELFERAAKLSVGIELNSSDMSFSDSEADIVLRPYKIAKMCRCKFYMGSDAHHPKNLYAAIDKFERAVELLGLTEDDKFRV